MTWKIWLRHQLLGVPLAALLHTALQFAYAYSPNVGSDWALLPIHWAAGMLFGSLILVPAFTVQAFVSVRLDRRAFGRGLQILAGGLTQAAVVGLWARFVGIEPSLPGNFSLTQAMVAAAFLAGGGVAAFAAPRTARHSESPSGAVSANDRVFGHRGLQTFMVLAALICFAGAIILALLLGDDPSEAGTAFGIFAAASLFCCWGAYLMSAEVRVGENRISWTRGRRQIVIPWSRVTEVRSTMGDELLIRSEQAKIGVDKQLDDYGSFYELIRKYAPPYAWEAHGLPLRCRARLAAPILLCVSGLAWVAAIWWLASYSPPADSTGRAIVIVATSLGGVLIPPGLYLATFRCEFMLTEFRVGYLFRRKTYQVADLADMKLTTVDTAEAARDLPGTVMPPLQVQQIEFRFKDGSELKISTQNISVAPEALYQLLRQYYIGCGDARRELT